MNHIRTAAQKRSGLTPEGETLFEMSFEKGYHCYRSFRYPWEGKCNIPYLLLEPQVDNLTLIFNKFGDDNVDYYNIYGDTSPNPTSLVDTSHSALKRLVDLQNGSRYYFRVTAVDKSGKESGYSNEESIIFNIIPPGNNLIINGDFTCGIDDWIWEVSGSASAEVQVNEGLCHFVIQNGGDQIYNVQLRQNNIPLIQGQDYTFEFDAWADANRISEIKVGKDYSPFTNYSRIGYSALTSTSKHFSFAFTMEESTDNNARVVINAGTDARDIYIDNLSLKMNVPSGTDILFPVGSGFLLGSNYPNPFNLLTTINYTIPEQRHVTLKVFDNLGREVCTLVDKVQDPGNYEVIYDASRSGGGIYFYRIEAGDFMQTKMMLLLKYFSSLY